MNKIEIRVDPNTGLKSSVKLGGVEIGQSVRSVKFHHEGGSWPTLTLELVSNDVLLDIPNAAECVGASKGISVWKATPVSEQPHNLLPKGRRR
jgi:hypothetical protein